MSVRQIMVGSRATRKCGASLTVGTPAARFGQVALPSRMVTPGVVVESTPDTPVWPSEAASIVTGMVTISPGSITLFSWPGLLSHTSSVPLVT